MPYRFEDKELISTAIPRIAREQNQRAIDNLTSDTNDLEEAVHDIRKRFKKIRAVLRLVRDELGEENYHLENKTYRDAGRKISDLRDHAVKLITLNSVIEKHEDLRESHYVAQIKDLLASEYRQKKETFIRNKTARNEVLSSIINAQSRIDTWPLLSDEFDALANGLKRVYKRGRKGFRLSLEKPDMEVLHDWRKRVKYLWYHVRILQPVWAEMMKPLSDILHRQSNLLGEDHDLAIVRQMILEGTDPEGDAGSKQLLLNMIDNRREELQKEALLLGEKIYAEKPAVFVRRIRTYWNASR